MTQIKGIFIATSLVALLVGCVDSSTGAAARADMEGDKQTETKTAPAPKAKEKAPVAQKADLAPATKAVAPAKETTPAEAEVVAATEKATPAAEETPAEAPAKTAPVTTSVDLNACIACHGAQFEKVAMGVSKVVKEMSKEDIVTALKGYRDGSYGASMRALMQGQVSSWDDAKIKAVAEQIKQ